MSEGMTYPTMMITGSAYFSESSQVAAESAGKVLKVYINAGNSPLDVKINNEQVLFSHLYDSSCLQKGGVIITKLL